MKIEIVLSWSGERSKAIARALYEWIPEVLQNAEPWMSERDIAPGCSGVADLLARLAQPRLGIVCLTPENTLNPWLHSQCVRPKKHHQKSA
jgi:hypothetical protein